LSDDERFSFFDEFVFVSWTARFVSSYNLAEPWYFTVL